jgi:putative membrane protein
VGGELECQARVAYQRPGFSLEKFPEPLADLPHPNYMDSRKTTSSTETDMNVQGIYHAALQNWANPVAANAIPEEDGEIEPNGFVTQVTAADAASIEAAQIALQQSQSAAIRAFALHAMVEHSRCADELQALACRKYLHGGLDSCPDNAAIDDLRALEPQAFDPVYALSQVMALEERVELLALAARQLDDLELEAFAHSALPTFLQLLKMARGLAAAHPAR